MSRLEILAEAQMFIFSSFKVTACQKKLIPTLGYQFEDWINTCERYPMV